MKKSEAIAIISEIFDAEQAEAEEIAEYFIDYAIKHVGMLPPCKFSLGKKHMKNKHSCIHVFEWEKDNESYS